MAITIQQQPYTYSVNRQRLIYVFTSDNAGNTGFRYKIVVDGDSEGELAQFFIAPNANGAAVFDASQLIASRSQHDTISGTVHAFSGGSIYGDDQSNHKIQLTVTEYWEIDGVLTENSGSSEGTDQAFCLIGYFDNVTTWKPDPNGTDTNTAFALKSNKHRWFSDRKYNTHVWQMAETFGITPTDQTIFIPCREADYGVLSFCNSTTYLADNAIDKIIVTLYDSAGAPHSHTETIGGGGEPHAIAGVYPSNLNDSTVTGIPKPSDYVGWRFYTVRALNSSSVAVSAVYVFYNAELYGQFDCNHDTVRLGWANSRGGWDYFNFIKRNEESLTIERRRYNKIRGNYGTAGDAAFSIGTYEAGLTDIAAMSDKYININSDWIGEQEWVFLQSLMVSQQVHWIQDDGSFYPVVIENTDYTMPRERNGKLKNFSLKLRMANKYT